MTSWSSLPPEIKQHVVKKLDFMSRHSLRSTSRLDRQIVDSTICKLPRVRFGYKENKSLIVIYTGIEKFLRWELTRSENGVIYERMENTMDPKDAIKKTLPIGIPLNNDLSHLQLFTSLLYFLIGHNSIKINVLECDWSNNGDIEDEDQNLLDIFRIMIKNRSRINVKKLEFMSLIPYRFKELIKEHINSEEVKHSSIVSLSIERESMIPLMHTKLVVKSNNGRMACFTVFVTARADVQDVLVLELMERRNEKIAFSHIDTTEKSVIKRVERKVEGDIVVMTVIDKCGKTVYAFFPSFEIEFMDYMNTEKCGLGSLCEGCADPFEYWYIQNLPSRVYYEPYWDSLYSSTPHEERKIEEFREKFEEDENRRNEMMKIEGVQLKKEVASWGFGAAKEPNALNNLILFLTVCFVFCLIFSL